MDFRDFWNGIFNKNNNSADIRNESAITENQSKPIYHVDSTPLTENEIKEFQQLYDNDFGARNEKVLDYNYPDYIKDGINRVSDS